VGLTGGQLCALPTIAAGMMWLGVAPYAYIINLDCRALATCGGLEGGVHSNFEVRAGGGGGTLRVALGCARLTHTRTLSGCTQTCWHADGMIQWAEGGKRGQGWVVWLAFSRTGDVLCIGNCSPTCHTQGRIAALVQPQQLRMSGT
jgi:hypothetical protein